MIVLSSSSITSVETADGSISIFGYRVCNPVLIHPSLVLTYFIRPSYNTVEAIAAEGTFEGGAVADGLRVADEERGIRTV